MTVKTGYSNVLSNLYEYDFSSCVYMLLRNIDWDLSAINAENKLERNIQIGYIRRNNPRVSAYLEESMSDLIDYYLRINNVGDSVVLRQKDGLILTKPMKKLNETLPIDFRGAISKLIFSLDRKKWIIIYTDNNKNVSVKGISSNLYDRTVFEFFKKFDYSNKGVLINNLENFRQFVFSSNVKKTWFILKEERENVDKYNSISAYDLYIPIKDVGYMKMRKSTISSLSIEDIEKKYLWEDYLWPFVESLFVYCS